MTNMQKGLAIVLSLAVMLIAMLTIQNMQAISQVDVNQANKEAVTIRQELLNGYADQIGSSIDDHVNEIFTELSILRGLMQTVIDQEETFMPLIEAMEDNPYFKDQLSYNGKWYQNVPEEPTAVTIHNYLVNPNGTIKEPALRELALTRFQDLFFPAFYDNGIQKQIVFYAGGVDAPFLRITPWADLGTLFFTNYPGFVDTSIWDTFYPGLPDDYLQRLHDAGTEDRALNDLLKVSPPVQDGLTGQLILTFEAPLFSPDRQTFRGKVAFDIPIDDLVQLVENVQIADGGFSFLAQSNGNVFAINQSGEELLGLGDVFENIDVTGQGVGFNTLDRMLADSSIPQIQALQLPDSTQPTYTSFQYEGVAYTLITKRLQPFLVWTPERHFHEESWVLGMVIPEEETSQEGSGVDQEMSDLIGSTTRLSWILLGLSVLLVGFFVFIMVRREKTSS